MAVPEIQYTTGATYNSNYSIDFSLPSNLTDSRFRELMYSAMKPYVEPAFRPKAAPPRPATARDRLKAEVEKTCAKARLAA